MRKLFAMLAALVATSALFFASAQNGPKITDRDFFNAVNLDTPGLEKVKADVAKSDYEAAMHDFVEYVKGRKSPGWFFDWKDFYKDEVRDKTLNTENADKLASNMLVSCNVWHQFGDTVDWSINPTEQEYHEWTWQLSRMYFWDDLGEAYWATGDEKYARAFVNQMRSWVIQNTVPEEINQAPYSRWRTIEAGMRVLGNWPRAMYRFLASPAFDDESVLMMIKSMYEHGCFLRKFHSSNNWLMIEMNGLFHVAVLFPEFKESAEWAKYASDRQYEEERIQYYPDGAQVELTTDYHWVSLKNILGLYKFAVLNGYKLPDDFVTRLEKTFDMYENVLTPFGNIPAVNDSEWEYCRDYVREGYNIFPQRKDFLYIASAGKEGEKPAKDSYWMPWAGWYTMRSGWTEDDLYAFFEVGPYGTGHQHEDKLSLILTAYGNMILTEGGRYAYDSSQWRTYVLSARSHNISRVDGKDQNRQKRIDEKGIKQISEPLTNRWISNENFDFGEGWYDEGFGEDLDKTVTQYRALTFVKDRYWILIDAFSPSDARDHSYESFFHFNTESYRELPELGAVMSDESGKANLTIARLNRNAGKMEVVCGQTEPEVQGWVPVDGANVYRCRPVATPVFKLSGKGRMVEPYILVPSKAGEGCPIKKIKSRGGNRYVISFVDGSKDRIDFSLTDDGRLKTMRVNGRDVL